MYLSTRSDVAITFLQSADPVRYARLLALSSQTVTAFCSLHRCSYEQTLGIRYGAKPWHAALNRITILKEYLDRGHTGWIVYLDADAFIADLSFDLANYLGRHGNKAMVAAPSGHLPPRWWEINNGVFALNANHPLAHDLVRHWHCQLRAIPEDTLKAEERWGDVADDQQMMHRAIQEVPGFEAALAIDVDSLLNWEGRFIQQVVRETGSFEQRLQWLSSAVDRVLTQTGAAAQRAQQSVNAADVRAQANEEFTLAIYKVLLRRTPDPGGFRSCVSALSSGQTSFLQELRACLSCDEFGENVEAFVNDFLSSETKDRLRRMLAAS